MRRCQGGYAGSSGLLNGASGIVAMPDGCLEFIIVAQRGIPARALPPDRNWDVRVPASRQTRSQTGVALCKFPGDDTTRN
jgi:hypothetical protein